MRLRHHDGVFGEEVGPGRGRVEGLELPGERLDRVDQLRHSDLDRLEGRGVRWGSAQIGWEDGWLCRAGMVGLWLLGSHVRIGCAVGAGAMMEKYTEWVYATA